MIDSLNTFYERSAPMIAALDEWAARMSPEATADHLCFKCADAAEFERMRALFERGGSSFVFQSPIAGRRIAVIGLTRPVPTTLGDIRFLELSDQKPDGSQTSGFDHMEIVPTAGTIGELAAALEQRGTVFAKTVRPHHTTFDAPLPGGFKIRLEEEPLVAKIARDEMR